MRNFLFCILIINLTFCSSQNSDNKKESQSIPNFDLKFPQTGSKIEHSVNDNSGDDYKITMWYMRGADSLGHPFMYILGHNKFTKSLKDKYTENRDSIDRLLKEALRGNATKLGGENLQFNTIKCNDYEGIELNCVVFKGNGILKSRAFKISNDIFLLSAGGQNVNKDSINMFFDSFKLTKVPSSLNLQIIEN